MTLLVIGLLFWSVPHILPSLAVNFRKSLIAKLGEGPYSGIVAFLILGGIVLTVFGWRSIVPEAVYFPPAFLKPATYLLMLFSLLLFIVSSRPSRIKLYIRHPQLTGMVLWSVAHLLQVGNNRSVVLFGWLVIWALLEMIFINHRDGVWVKEAAPAWTEEVKTVVVILVVYTVVAYVHPYISGVSII